MNNPVSIIASLFHKLNGIHPNPVEEALFSSEQKELSLLSSLNFIKLSLGLSILRIVASAISNGEEPIQRIRILVLFSVAMCLCLLGIFKVVPWCLAIQKKEHIDILNGKKNTSSFKGNYCVAACLFFLYATVVSNAVAAITNEYLRGISVVIFFSLSTYQTLFMMRRNDLAIGMQILCVIILHFSMPQKSLHDSMEAIIII